MLKQIKNLKFKGISDDSRNVKKGDIFFAIEGSRFDGHRFIDEAIERGAIAVVTGKGAPAKSAGGVKIIRVANPRVTLARFASEFYRHPSRKLKVIGITGTNGKTTISYLLARILQNESYKTGIIGTISHSWKDTVIEAKNTTPGAVELQRMLSMMEADSIKYCAMEVSSHSLDQDRILGVDFHAAIFTNITGEHLDYHKQFRKYIDAKTKLFKMLKSDKTAILNLDDANFKKIKNGASAKIITYGIKNKADVRADEIHCDLGKTEFLVRTKGGSFSITSPLTGMFNVYNILAAVSLALNEGIPVESIKEAVSDFKGAEGRMEPVVSSGEFKVFIDYAHTDNALENVLSALKDVAKNKLIVVFGCGGDRDRLKRPRMGRAASRLADYVFITSDNPRSENPLTITREIEAGLGKGFKNYKILIDRFEAIKAAIDSAGPGDIILIAGKGHEKYQIIGNRALPFSDREVVEKILSAK